MGGSLSIHVVAVASSYTPSILELDYALYILIFKESSSLKKLGVGCMAQMYRYMIYVVISVSKAIKGARLRDPFLDYVADNDIDTV